MSDRELVDGLHQNRPAPCNRTGTGARRLGTMPGRDEQSSIERERLAVVATDGRPAMVRATERLLISCPPRRGITPAVWRFLSSAGADPVTVDQRTSAGGRMFIRAELDLPLAREQRRMLEQRFLDTVAKPFSMDFRIADASRRKRIAVLVSRYDHCLVDLLWRWRRRDLEADIGLVASNHPDLEPLVSGFGVPWHHVPVTKERKREAEQRLLELLAGRFDVVVLARYMQILSREFLRALGVPVINVHHSLLPAFVGAATYERAIERGVKLVGATAHYVTAELDAGPIIEQDAVRISDRDDLQAVTRAGADLERLVLARAVGLHCEDRIAVHDNTTVIF